MRELIDRESVLDCFHSWVDKRGDMHTPDEMEEYNAIEALPTIEVVRCKDCKHWTQSMGKMKGYGLGRCDFHDADLVTCNGYCYWAERRTDAE